MPIPITHPKIGYLGEINKTVNHNTTAVIAVLIKILESPSLCNLIFQIEEQN